MKRRKKVNWSSGDIFLIPLQNGYHGYGQVVDTMMTNVVNCTFFDCISSSETPDLPYLSMNNVVSCIAVTREQLDYNVWSIIGSAELVCSRAMFLNEKYSSAGYVGAKIYDASIAEEFLSAFHGILPWDDWHDPFYLDALLISQNKKPKDLKYKQA